LAKQLNPTCQSAALPAECSTEKTEGQRIAMQNSSRIQVAKIISFGASDLGRKRTNNEDSLVVKPELGLCVVADGISGAGAGELASQLLTDAALELFRDSADRSEQRALELVQKVFRLANERILHHVRQYPRNQGMGCTAELLVFTDQSYVLGHVGDSRTYLFRKGRMKQLTRDHSLVQDQLDQGLITLAESRKHPLRSIILKAVGTNEHLAVDLVRGRIFPGDLFLLCSDGLTDMVEDYAIQEVLATALSLEQKGEKLIDLANAAGGHDNVTVLLGEVLSMQ
jgi:serine/threonine protein phosphatase PrpC